MKINFNSIIFKTLFSLLLLSVIFISYISISSKYTFSSGYTSLIQEKISIIKQSINPSISLNLSYGFDDAINEIGEKILENENVLLLKIDSYSDKKVFAFSKNTKTIDEYREEKEFISFSELIDPATAEKIGKMTLIYSKKSYDEFMNRFYIWFFTAMIMFTFAMLFLSLYLYKALKPLGDLAFALDSFNPKKPRELNLSVKDKNEVSSITNAANLMIENLIRFLNYSKALNVELSQKQNHLKEAQRIANVGSWEYDIHDDTLTLSDEIYRILGIKNIKLSFEELLSLVCEKDIKHTQSTLKHAIDNGSNFDLKYCVNVQNGKQIQLHTIGKVRKKATGDAKITAVSMDITQDMKNKQMIEKLAYYDILTSLPNRALLKDRITQALQNAQRYDNQVALIFLDLDHFKLINDTLGHSTGDKLLIYVSEVLAKQIRKSDTLARLGGDEFVILLPDIKELNDAKIIAKKIINAFAGQHHIQTHQLYITTSIGISLYPATSSNMDELITNADTAMYDAKQDGRNQYKIYSKDMGNFISSQMRIEQDLKKAINSKTELEVYYQAKIDTKNGFISGAEALIRWNHPEHGLMYPDEFIGVAESTGMILDMGRWIIEESIFQLQEWNRVGFSGLNIAINLSAKQFQDSQLVSFITSMIEKYSVVPSQLEFEITESLSMSNMDATLRVLHELKNLGVSIAIDDFGTGYSSLSYLKQFPVHTLKIDKSFVMDMVESDGDKVIVKTIISMAHSLGFKTVAEGVETQEHVEILQDLKCDYLQGYHYTKAIPKDEFTEFLKNYTPLN